MHALIRETLYSELSSPRRVKLHRHVADALERLRRACRACRWPSSRTTSQAAAADVADKSIDYAMRAGDRAANGWRTRRRRACSPWPFTCSNSSLQGPIPTGCGLIAHTARPFVRRARTVDAGGARAGGRASSSGCPADRAAVRMRPGAGASLVPPARCPSSGTARDRGATAR